MGDDEFYLAWLARECRFHVSVHFVPANRLGYRLIRRAIVTPKHEPALAEWLASKDIHSRTIKDVSVLRTLLHLLRPVGEHVRDREGMLRLLQVIDIPLRGMTHEHLFGDSDDYGVLLRHQNQISMS